MDKTLTIGRTYAVTTATSCTVTDANGTLLTTAYAGQQVVFVAPTTTVTFSDNSATVVAVFKLALAKTRLFEQLGGGRLPDGYIPAHFLENTGSQYIDTKLQTYSDSVISITAQQVYAAETYTTGFVWFFGSVQNPGMNIGFSVSEYKESSILGYVVIGNKGGNMRDFAAARYDVLNITNTATQFVINGETATDTYSATHAPVPGSEITYPIFAYRNSGGNVGINKGCRIFSFSDTTPSQGGKRLDLVPAIAPDGAPCMYDKVTNQPLVNAGDDSFIVGMTAAQARKLGNLPDGGDTLTISLPPDVVDENGVLQDMSIFTALSQAAAKGWSFILQTHDGSAVETAVPAGYMECEFLESTGEQQIESEIFQNDYVESEFVFQFTKFTGARQLFGLNAAANFFGIRADGNWEQLSSPADLDTHTVKLGITHSSGAYFIELDNIRKDMQAGSWWKPETVSKCNPITLSVVHYPCHIRSYGANATDGTNLLCSFIPSITPAGVPCMYDKVSGQPFYNKNTAEGAPGFVVGMTAAQAVQLANLPEDAADKTLTVSLPQSILNDEGKITDAAVRAALNKAADNGWDITLQYYTN